MYMYVLFVHFIYVMNIHFVCHRFVYAHLHQKCCRKVLVEYFGEDATDLDCPGECCDVCSGSNNLKNSQAEMMAVCKAVRVIPGTGETKVRHL